MQKTNHLNHLLDSSFQEVNRLLVLSFENDNGRTSHSGYYLPKLETKDCNAKTESKNFFGQPISNYVKTYENIRKITSSQGDDYATGCLLDYTYFKENYKMFAIDLIKQQALDADPRAI